MSLFFNQEYVFCLFLRILCHVDFIHLYIVTFHFITAMFLQIFSVSTDDKPT